MIDAIDKNIREGKMVEAREMLERLIDKKVPRANTARVASLCWRANVPHLGLRILFPIIRSERLLRIPPGDQELMEYAICLTKIGAAEEGIQLLNRIDPEHNPRALLFKSFALMSQWDYVSVIPLLQRYITTPQVSEYQRMVGRVNLGAAFTYERQHSEATELFNELAKWARTGNHTLLLSNSLHLSAANHIMQGDFDKARNVIEEAKTLLKGTSTLDEFFVRKWDGILSFLTHPKSKPAIQVLHALRKEAERIKHWESLRDIDRYEAMTLKDTFLLNRLYFGTPYESFRKRLLTDFKGKPEIMEMFPWQLGEGDKVIESRVLIDGKNAGNDLRQGQVLYRLVAVLSTDFYRPIRIATIHHRLHPEDFFNPISSPARIHVSVSRLRLSLEKYKIPFTVAEDSGGYRLVGQPSCKLLIPGQIDQRDSRVIALEKIREKWNAEPFSAKQASEVLSISERTALRVLTLGIEKGNIAREGKTSKIKYRFVA